MSGFGEFALEFALGFLPPPPARVLAVGWAGEELAARGHAVEARDAVGGVGSFDAVLVVGFRPAAAAAATAADRLAALVAPGGVACLEGSAAGPLDDPTAEWLHGQLRAAAAASGGPAPAPLAACRAQWDAEHAPLASADAVRAALGRRFEERAFAREPGLHRRLGGVAAEALERTLVELGAIQATAYRYAGVRR